ncbi:MAG: hypothetical protein QG575_2100 [Euryarchaeota archaeon]|nr:hypothetical protein [Euryarchaeota archaeon]
MTERRDSLVVSCITKRQKADLADFCWQNRITKSELVMTLIDDFLSEIRVKT